MRPGIRIPIIRTLRRNVAARTLVAVLVLPADSRCSDDYQLLSAACHRRNRRVRIPGWNRFRWLLVLALQLSRMI